MIVGVEQFEIEPICGDRELFLRVKSLLDGRHTIDEISNRTGVPFGDIQDLIALLGSLGVLRSEASSNCIPADEFLKRVDHTSLMWSRQIGFHPLFQSLESREARMEVFVGLILETYHYVKSAALHTATAASYCSHPEWDPLLREYLMEERDHSELIIDTLERMGFGADLVRMAHPLIGTLSLIHMLCEVGRVSTLAYLGCTRLFEARADEQLAARASFLELAHNYGFSPEMMQPILAHHEGDVSAGHTSLLEQALEGTDSISAEDAHLVVNCMHDVKHAFDQFHDQILAYYGDISNYIPRLTVDYFSL